MWPWLAAVALLSGLSAPGNSLPQGPNSPTSPGPFWAPALSVRHELATHELIPLESKKHSRDATLSNPEISSNPETTSSQESTWSEMSPISAITSEPTTFSNQTARNTVSSEDAQGLSSTKPSSSLKYLASISSPYAIHKCCPRGQYSIAYNSCKPLAEGTNSSDSWWWIKPSYRQNLSLDTLPDSQVSYGWKPCAKKSLVMLFLYDDTVTLHRRLDGIRLEFAVEEKEGNETTHEFAPGSYCLDGGGNGVHLVQFCPCSEMMCLRKCCKFGEEFDPVLRKCMERANDHGDWLPAFDKDWKIDQKYYTLEGYQQCAEHEKPFPYDDMKSNLDLIFLSNGQIKSNVTGAVFPRDGFCGDLTPSGYETLVVCHHSATSQERMISITMGVLLAIGSFALLLTVVISCALPDTRRRLHGRLSLMHNVTLLVAYVSTGALRIIAVWYNMSVALSKVVSFVIQFSFLSAFFWLHVMCIDIAMVFRACRPLQGTGMQQDERKFVYYSAYVWGSVCLISALTAIVEFVPGARPRPAFGEKGYFFNNDSAMLLFFYGPIAILLVANVILFIFTAVKIKMAVNESTAILDSMDSRTTKRNKFRLAVYAKLSTLMGVTWVFEVLSWAIGGDARVWILTDAVNLLRAVFIFIIFCCNKQVYKMLRLRALTFVGRGTSRESTDTYGRSKMLRTTVL